MLTTLRAGGAAEGIQESRWCGCKTQNVHMMAAGEHRSCCDSAFSASENRIHALPFHKAKYLSEHFEMNVHSQHGVKGTDFTGS